MNCTECEKLIDDYIYNRLDEKTTDAFVKHVLGCGSCLEELRVNYSVMTALDQMDRGDELSEDYEAELNEKLVKYVMKKKRKRRVYIGVCTLLLFASVFVGIIFSMFFLTAPDVEYGDDDKKISFIFDGVPDYIDPVDLKINEYNQYVIDKMHEYEIEESKIRTIDLEGK